MMQWSSLFASTMFLTSLLRSRSVAFSVRIYHHGFLYRHQSSRVLNRVSGGQRFLSTTDSSGLNKDDAPPPMANLYAEWSLEDDRLLFENRMKTVPELASMFGRGLRGVESRLAKLSDVNSPAYTRLFAQKARGKETEMEEDYANQKLVTANEVLKRIQWDYYLDKSDFSVLHYDRVEDTLVESPMDTPNTSVEGKEPLLVLAIPEHRVAAIKYKERIVWDREERIDRVFGSMNGKGETIQDVLASYDEWKAQKDATEEWNRKRQAEVSLKISAILGSQRFDTLKELSSNLLDETSPKKEVIETYVQSALQLFRDARQDVGMGSSTLSSMPTSDVESLDIFSELVALLPNSALRPSILLEITSQMNRLEGTKPPSIKADHTALPELDERDLVETFVRGSGAGGQKVNKTANKVVLLHEPTQLRVECQETRSLTQNRKIARKRLRLKLDEYLNGSQSKASLKNSKAASKKQKAKARNKARLKKKKQEQAE